jgi:pimeloyl-ACP methyl ester carboxylesterase
MLYRREWGAGQPVIAMHPLGLESSAFEGFGAVLARRGLRTIAVDLPGFGRTPADERPPTAAAMAAPVIELARSLETPPVVLGISMGGRVALEAALTAPEAFGGVIAIAPYLPWVRFRWLLEWAHWIDPRVAEWVAVERAWPVLRVLAGAFERLPYLRDDEVAQAGARFVYYLSCPATRAGFVAAAREMMLDPADGPHGFWTRLPSLGVPGAFVWGERDRLVSLRFARAVSRRHRDVPQLLLPCLGHWVNGPHHRCLADAVADLVFGGTRVSDEPAPEHASGVRFHVRRCLAPVGAGGPMSVAEATHGP